MILTIWEIYAWPLSGVPSEKHSKCRWFEITEEKAIAKQREEHVSGKWEKIFRQEIPLHDLRIYIKGLRREEVRDLNEMLDKVRKCSEQKIDISFKEVKLKSEDV